MASLLRVALVTCAPRGLERERERESGMQVPAQGVVEQSIVTVSLQQGRLLYP